ncbi:MAG: retinol dehydrogenase [Prevotella multiformis]|uniref:retinol dehydrogenase n=1 Tax=Prevotella multiformis TaxID=282402 RepID=UPI003FA083EC
MIALVHIDRPVPFINMAARQTPDRIGIQNSKIAADHLAESAKGDAYEAQAKKTAEGMRKQYSGSMMSDPKIVARAISRAANTRRPKARYLIGFGAKPLVFLHTLLPARWFDWFMMHAS